jgi:hypothetical protein
MSNVIISSPSNPEPETRATYDLSIHTNPDAQAWAKFWIETLPNMKDGWEKAVWDEELMTGWFANAMMAMHDHLKGQAQKERAQAKCDHPIGVSFAHDEMVRVSTLPGWKEVGISFRPFAFCPDCGSQLTDER